MDLGVEPASEVSNWRVTGGYGFTNATYGDYLVNATTNLNGNTSIMAPRHTFSIRTAYDSPNGFGINVGARYRRGAVEYALNVNNLTETEYFASVLYTRSAIRASRSTCSVRSASGSVDVAAPVLSDQLFVEPVRLDRPFVGRALFCGPAVLLGPAASTR